MFARSRRAATLLSSHAEHLRPATSDTTKGSQAKPADSLKESQLAARSGPSPRRRTTPTTESKQQASERKRGSARHVPRPSQRAVVVPDGGRLVLSGRAGLRHRRADDVLQERGERPSSQFRGEAALGERGEAALPDGQCVRPDRQPADEERKQIGMGVEESAIRERDPLERLPPASGEPPPRRRRPRSRPSARRARRPSARPWR